jgi:TatD DNase family protein
MILPKRKIVDTHSHICDSSFDADRGEVLEKAAEAGVGAIIALGEDLADARRNIELAGEHPMICPAAGLYPTILDLDQAEQMQSFIRQKRAKLVAIGEVGLDFWVVKEAPQKELQKEILKGFISLSQELDLPLNIHSRSAGRHAVAWLLENGATRVQMHAFDGKASAAMPAVEAGFFFSIPPSVIRSRQKQKLVKHLPLSCLLAETDSPVLGPEPNERNEPANVLVSIKAIAELKGIEEEMVTEAVIENTQKLYGELKLRAG